MIPMITPLKTNMTLDNFSIFNWKYVFKWWMFHCLVSFGGEYCFGIPIYFCDSNDSNVLL